MDFIAELAEPLFFIIHISLSKHEEEKLRKSDMDPYHEEVFYLDGCDKEQIYDIFNKYGEILLNDGFSQFGVASHSTKDELFVQKYKIPYIYSKNIDKYIYLMNKYNIGKTQNLVTVRNTFSCENYGECRTVTINQKNIDDVVEDLKEIGLYSAKIIEVY